MHGRFHVVSRARRVYLRAMTTSGLPPAGRREPLLNLPPAVAGFLLLIAGIHLLRVFVLSDDANYWVLLTFAFLPARISGTIDLAFPGGIAGELWTFVTYGLLHANFAHLIVNGVWLAAFGSPLAWRFGVTRFLLFSAGGAAAGALAHLALHSGEAIPLVGASAAISAHMAAICRFGFGTLGSFRAATPEDWQRPARPLVEALRDRRVLGFLIAWFAVNLAFGLTNAGGAVQSGAIAWEAHIGGFLFGLLAFRFFDPYRNPAVDRTAP
jgi:membrane associated rhomboid family serine protease